VVSGKRGADNVSKFWADVDTGVLKAPSRNKACPCGSGRKHKKCCGGAGGTGNGACGKAAAAAAVADSLPAALGTLHI
jgi:hypothetical protein